MPLDLQLAVPPADAARWVNLGDHPELAIEGVEYVILGPFGLDQVEYKGGRWLLGFDPSEEFDPRMLFVRVIGGLVVTFSVPGET